MILFFVLIAKPCEFQIRMQVKSFSMVGVMNGETVVVNTNAYHISQN